MPGPGTYEIERAEKDSQLCSKSASLYGRSTQADQPAAAHTCARAARWLSRRVVPCRGPACIFACVATGGPRQASLIPRSRAGGIRLAPRAHPRRCNGGGQARGRVLHLEESGTRRVLPHAYDWTGVQPKLVAVTPRPTPHPAGSQPTLRRKLPLRPNVPTSASLPPPALLPHPASYRAHAWPIGARATTPLQEGGGPCHRATA